jgi:hypothetical protein
VHVSHAVNNSLAFTPAPRAFGRIAFERQPPGVRLRVPFGVTYTADSHLAESYTSEELRAAVLCTGSGCVVSTPHPQFPQRERAT